jgi:hypothetical protein
VVYAMEMDCRTYVPLRPENQGPYYEEQLREYSLRTTICKVRSRLLKSPRLSKKDNENCAGKCARASATCHLSF